MKIALTFDDGPNVTYTDMILDVLEFYGVPATFFMIGQFVREQPEIAKRVAAAGHWIGNHTFSHPKLTECAVEEVVYQIGQCESILTDTVGQHSKMFRPPFMLTSPWVEKMASVFRLQTIKYTAAAGDGTQRGCKFHFGKIMEELDGQTGIILMHDGCHENISECRIDTVETTETLIKYFKSRSYEFVSPEALECQWS